MRCEIAYSRSPDYTVAGSTINNTCAVFAIVTTMATRVITHVLYL